MAIESTPESESCTHCGYLKPHCNICGGDFDDMSLTACLCIERGKLPELVKTLSKHGASTNLLHTLLSLSSHDIALLTSLSKGTLT